MKNLKKMGKNDLIFLLIVHISVVAISIVILYALWFVVIASISDPNMVASGEVLFLPKGLTLEGYKYIFRDKRIWIGYRNTILYTAVIYYHSCRLCIVQKGYGRKWDYYEDFTFYQIFFWRFNSYLSGGKWASSGGYTVCFDDNGFIFSIQSDFVSYFFH